MDLITFVFNPPSPQATARLILQLSLTTPDAQLSPENRDRTLQE